MHYFLKIFSLLILVSVFKGIKTQAQTNEKVTNQLVTLKTLYNNGNEIQALATVTKLLNSAKINNKARVIYLRWQTRLFFELGRDSKTKEAIIKILQYEDDPDVEKFHDPTTSFKKYFKETVDSYYEGKVFVNKYTENIDLSPSVITIYNKDDIKMLGARNLIDLLVLTPGFTELGDDNERNFGTRGIYGTTVQNVLFLINGHRINDLITSSSAPDWISLDYVEQVEIMRGPGSALYGGNAFSGVVNVITKNGRSFNGKEGEFTVGSSQLTNTESSFWDHQYKFNYQFGGRLKNRDKVYFSGTILHSGGSVHQYDENTFITNQVPNILPDFRTNTDTIPPNTQGREYINKYRPGYNFLFNYQGKNIVLTANAQRNSLAIHRPGSGNLWDNDAHGTYRDKSRIDSREFIQIDFPLYKSKQKTGRIDAKVSFDHFTKDFYTNSYSKPNPYEGDTSLARLVGDEYRFGFEAQYSTKDWSIFKGKDRKPLKSISLMGVQLSTTGWDYQYHVSTDSTHRLHYNPSKEFFSGDSTTTSEDLKAFFFQSSQHIINDRLIGTIGFRLNYHPEYADFNEIRFGDEISPRASLVLISQPNKKGNIPYKIKLLYNSAFLPPPFLYRKGGITGFTGSTNLRSQKIQSLELSVNGDINKQFQYQVNYFVNGVYDYINRQNDQYVNAKDTRRIGGLELGLKYYTYLGNESNILTVFGNVAGTTMSVVEKDGANIFELLAKDNFNDSTLYYYPAVTISGGVTVKHLLQENKSIEGSFIGNYFSNPTVVSSVTFDPNTAIWQNNTNHIYTLNQNQIPLNLKATCQYKANDFYLRLSLYNILDSKYQLPSVISKTGAMPTDNFTALITAGFSFDKFLNSQNEKPAK